MHSCSSDRRDTLGNFYLVYIFNEIFSRTPAFLDIKY